MKHSKHLKMYSFSAFSSASVTAQLPSAPITIICCLWRVSNILTVNVKIKDIINLIITYCNQTRVVRFKMVENSQVKCVSIGLIINLSNNSTVAAFSQNFNFN